MMQSAQRLMGNSSEGGDARKSQIRAGISFAPRTGVAAPELQIHRPTVLAQPSHTTKVLYAVVLYDFVSGRADELDAKVGDPLSVVAIATGGWVVAKPIIRLGRPGLIPITFVELRDPISNMPILDIEALIDRGGLPWVQDWKRDAMNYARNSIVLGEV